MPEILGIRIDNLDLEAVKTKVGLWMSGTEQKKIFTPNPEMLVLANKLPYFKNVLNQGDLNLCDGFGITLVSGGKIKRISGSDFIWDLCKLAEKGGKGVFLLGSGDEDVLEKTKDALNNKFVQLRIVGMDIGPKIQIVGGDIEINTEENENVLNKINKSGAEVLIVAFGQVKQELWIREFLPNLLNVKVAIGVGGALDYIAGKVKRAPKFLRVVGLEWLWRLFREPWRVKRVFNATVRFTFYYFFK